MNIVKKIFLSLMIMICIVNIIPLNISTVDASVSGLVGDLDSKLPANDLSSGIRSTIQKLLGFLQVASGLVAVVVIAITGFNYIVAAPDVKKELKDKMLPMLIGLVLVFGAASIAKFILGAVEGSSGPIYVEL